MNNNTYEWFKLDNAGKLYPSVATDRYTTVFRVSATLVKDIDPGFLQLALDRIMKRFPYFNVHLKRGFFWHYFEKANSLPQIEQETFYPCIYMLFRKKYTFPFRVLYFKKKISLEMTHCLSDGTGAMIFLKSLIAEYLRLNGIEATEKSTDIFVAGEAVHPQEFEDAFKKYYKNTTTERPVRKRAVHFPFPLCKRGVYRIVTGIIPVKPLLARAKSYGVSLTTFLLALYYETIIDYFDSLPVRLRRRYLKPVTLNVPVNMRNMYPSRTMKNFFISVNPLIDPRTEHFTFEEIIRRVAALMQEAITKEKLDQYITRNVKTEISIFIRLLPLILKDVFMPLVYQMFGENLYTSSISNIGRVSMPEPLNDAIERFEFYPPPSRGNKIKVGVVSFKDKLYITFGKLTEIKSIEKIFFRKLIEMGIPVKIETN